MGTPFLGEIKMVSFNYSPKGWALANGQFLPINQNQALFSLFGTMYGGNGQTTFALPDLRGRVPIHQFDGFTVGQAGGQEFHTITQSEMPAHTHMLSASQNTATTETPTSSLVLAGTAPNDLYTGFAGATALLPQTVSNVGGSQPHENRQPYLVINYIVALIGIFPSQN
jgi:microcystin-dependent protein